MPTRPRPLLPRVVLLQTTFREYPQNSGLKERVQAFIEGPLVHQFVEGLN